MARMHSRKKGKSKSTRPPRPSLPEWYSMDNEDVEDLVIKYSKEGIPQAKIGLIMRDQHGVPLVKLATGKKIANILKENDLLPPVPEDILNLIKKANNLRRHLDDNKKDLSSKRGLLLVESKIYRLSKYYRKTGKLASDWKYDWKKAAILIR